jgi:uncharacterized membrane protein YccC
MRPTWPRISDPGLASLKSAARAAIVMPAVFAVASQLIKQPQAEIFAPFGTFALLVLTDFGGPPKSRLTAYLSLAGSGVVLVTVGTLCSRNAWLAAAAMAVVGFIILFSGIVNGYFAAASTGAILVFVLPVSIPAEPSAIGWRLAGWGLACAVSITAAMLLWPPRRAATLRHDAARACQALADLAESTVSAAGQQATDDRAGAARDAIEALRQRLKAAPHQSTGPTRQAAALAALVDELGWLLRSLRVVAELTPAQLCEAEQRESMAAAAAALRASAGRLTGQAEQPDTGRVDRAQVAVVKALIATIAELPPDPDDQTIESLLGRLFRTRAIAYTTRQIAGYALVTSGAAGPQDTLAGPPRQVGQRAAGISSPHLGRLAAAFSVLREFAAEHAGGGSVWLRNSIRAAVGLAIAVFIAQRSGLQHSFWVVLGTLSVLRSNALGTGRSVLRALAGTAAGIVIGAALVLAVGDTDPVLWGVLPVAVLIAAYAPRAISFAAGQAAFTVVLVVLFNIIQPTGWTVGLVRIEDVAIGFAVSLGVGLVFWPRGAAAVLRQNLGNAYSWAANYIAVTARQLSGDEDPADPGATVQAEQAATAAVHQLDDAYRQYLGERSAKQENPESAARLVAGVSRVVRAGRSMAGLWVVFADGRWAGSPQLYADRVAGQLAAVRSWYVTLGDALANGTTVPPPRPPDPRHQRELLQYLRDATATGQSADLHAALLVLWVSQHLEMLQSMEEHLVEQAAAASAQLARPAIALRP